MRAQSFVVLALLLSACSRSLDLPPPPGPVGPGLIQGRVVYSKPGRAQPEPAVGAELFVLNSSLSARAGAEGRFVLDGIKSTDGTLLVRFDLDGDGAFDRQKMLRFDDLGAGPGRQVSLGDVVLGQNGRLEGKVLRADLGGARSGHAGTSLFVPEGPYITQTADDGSFALEGLPEGKLKLGVMRPGYAPVVLDELTLGAGQNVVLTSIVLQPDTSTVSPGSVTGRVLQTDGQGVPDAVVRFLGGAAALTVTVEAGGSWRAQSVPEGRYDLVIGAPGFRSAQVFNAVVVRGAETSTPDVVLERILSDSSDEDGGTPSLVQPAGLDAGAPPEAPPFDAGFGVCVPRDGGTHAPTAVFDPPPLAVGHGEPISLLGGRSFDPDCQLLLFTWTETTDAGVGISPNGSFTAARATVQTQDTTQFLRFSLRVTDPDGNTDESAAHEVAVVARPQVVVQASPSLVMFRPDAGGFDGGLPAVALLDASGSTDLQGYALTFAWHVVSGPGVITAIDPTGTKATLAPTGLGAIEVQVEAFNGFLSRSANVTVTASDKPTGGVNVFINGPTTMGPGASGTLTAQVTSTLPGETFTYKWSTASGAAFSFATDTALSTGFTAPGVVGTSVAQVAVTSQQTGSVTTRTLSIAIGDLAPPMVIESRPDMSAGANAQNTVAWIRWSKPLDPALVNASTVYVTNTAMATVPATVGLDNTTNTIFLVYQRPLVAGDYVLHLGAMGTTLTSITRPFFVSAPQFGIEFHPTLSSSEEIRPGLTWVDRSLVATGRRHDNTSLQPCSGFACFSAFGTDSMEPNAQPDMLSGGNAMTRRALTANGRAYSWGSSLDWYERTPPPAGTGQATWTRVASAPPGPTFFLGALMALEAAGVGMKDLYLTAWQPGASPGTGAWARETAPVTSLTGVNPNESAAVSSGKSTWVIAAALGSTASWYSRSDVAGWAPWGAAPSNIQPGSQLRMAMVDQTPTAVVRDSGGTLFATSWDPVGLSWRSYPIAANLLATSTFDAVSLGSVLYVAWTDSIGQLKVAAVDFSGANPTQANLGAVNGGLNALGGTTATCPAFHPELAASGFGLGLAWAENCAGVWTYYVRKL